MNGDAEAGLPGKEQGSITLNVGLPRADLLVHIKDKVAAIIDVHGKIRPETSMVRNGETEIEASLRFIGMWIRSQSGYDVDPEPGEDQQSGHEKPKGRL